MKRVLTPAVLLWLLAMVTGGLIALRTHYTADMSVFMPRSPTAEQQLLVDQFKDGAISRMLLIGIEGGDETARATLSRGLAERMRASSQFSSVRNGDAAAMVRDREILFSYRYLLSPAVGPERFSVDGLREAIGNSIDLLASPAGLMVKGLLSRDPTGELMELLGNLSEGGGPPSRDGVWFSRDGKRAILLAQTRAAGSDTDAQEAALAAIGQAFAELAAREGVTDGRVLMSGSPVFSVDARARIRSEITRLSLLCTAGVVMLLLAVYRSPVALALGLLPVATGALAGIVAVSLGFGAVHGITIGFGTTLIGEAVDYTIYYFVQSGRQGLGREAWMQRFWPTIRLGVATSVCGFSALLFSGFPGLAQLGLYSIAGLLAAALSTRFVVPHLCPAHLAIRPLDGIGNRLSTLVGRAGALRWALGALCLIAVAAVFTHRNDLWNPGLSSLSPVPEEAKALDHALRSELGAPDLRYLVVVSAPSQDAALVAAETAARALQPLVGSRVIGGFENPARFLPSEATQRARQQALPSRELLAARLPAALAGLPLQPAKLEHFLADVEAARHQPLLDRETLTGSTLALASDSLILQRAAGWSVLLPLRAPLADGQAQDIDAAAVRTALAGQADTLFVDLLDESTRLYGNYLNEAILLSLAGALVIVLLLAATLRSLPRLLRVLTPLLMAVLLVVGGLALAGERMTLLHLVGILLIVAVGSNYALFFDRASTSASLEPSTLASLLLANITTVIGFGVLAFSQVPVLHAMGVTVGPGAILALLISAAMATPRGRQAP